MILVGVVVVVVVLVVDVAAASARLTHMERHLTSKHIIHQLGGETSDMRRDVMMINGSQALIISSVDIHLFLIK